MMASFIVKEESETIRHFKLIKCTPILNETRRNRGNRHWKIDLCLKRCLKIQKKAETYKIPREIIRV